MAEHVNDVNVPAMKEFDKKVRENPALAKRTVKVRASWLRGTKTLVEIGEHQTDGVRATPVTRKFMVTADAPPALFEVPIDALDIEMDASIDFRGLLGHDKSVRNGFSDIRYTVTIQSPASEDKVRRCKETIDRKSPVMDVVTKPVNVTSSFVYKPR